VCRIILPLPFAEAFFNSSTVREVTKDARDGEEKKPRLVHRQGRRGGAETRRKIGRSDQANVFEGRSHPTILRAFAAAYVAGKTDVGAQVDAFGSVTIWVAGRLRWVLRAFF
jgi:hypothetical protein